MSVSKHITIVRHGETDFNKNRIVQGSGIDSSLNAHGLLQARAFWEVYRHQPYELVVTSALQRTRQTVAAFIEEKKVEWITTSDINEINWGDHEGKKGTPDRILLYQQMIAEWGKGNLNARLPNGESAKELVHRISVFLKDLKSYPQGHILVCTHGRALRCMMVLMKNENLGEMEKYQHANTGVFQVEYTDNFFKVKCENDLSHLKQLISSTEL